MADAAPQTSPSLPTRWIHLFVMFLLFFSGWFLPTLSTITPFGIKIVSVFTGMIYDWMFIGLILPSLSGMLFLSFAGLGNVKAVFGQGFGSEIVLLIIFFSIFTKWLEEIGLTNTFAQWLLTRRFLSGRPFLFIFMIFCVTFLCAFFVGIYPAIFLMWGICYRLLTNLGYAKRCKTSAYLLIGIAYVSIMGMTIKPWSSWSMLGINALVESTGLNYNFLPYSFFMLSVSLASILLFLLCGKLILHIDTTPLQTCDFTQLAGKINYTAQQKIGTFMLFFILVCLYLPSTLPKGSSLYIFLTNLGPVGVIALVIILLCLFTHKNEPLLDFVHLAAQSIPWNMICLLAAVGPLGTALMHQEANITPTILLALKPLLAGQSPFMLYASITLFAVMLTQFMNNTVLLVALTPMLCQLAGLLGANPLLITALLIFALSAAMATPGASSRAGLVFGNAEWITTKDAYQQGILSVCCITLALLLIGLPLGLLLFG